MTMYPLRRLGLALVLLFASVGAHPQASAAAPPDDSTPSVATPGVSTPGVSAPAISGSADDSEDWFDMDDDDASDTQHHSRRRHQHHGNDLVSIGHNATLAAGLRGDSVVSIFGTATNEGDAEEVVSVFGNTRVTGPVRDTAVSVLGSTYIDSKVDGDVVAVLGNMELGPHAEIGGQVVTVLGTVRRDPAAIVRGGVQNVSAVNFGGFAGLHSWINHGLFYGRPLAFQPDLGWAWGMALGLLAIYAGIALLFRGGVERCVRTLETNPGHSLLAAIVTMLLSPVLIVLLFVTVIGIAAIPFVAVAFLCVLLFGKAAMLAWLGGRIAGRPATGPASHPAVAVLLGGAGVLVLYLVPVLGFLVFQLLGIFGFGAVMYTLVLMGREHQAAKDSQRDHTRAGAAYGAAAGANAASAAPGSASAADATAAPAGAATAAPQVTAAMPRAGFWIRMAALLLDVILVGFALGVLHHSSHLQLIALGIYGAIMWKVRGSTVGGIVFDLRVVRLDGREVDWETAIVRALGCFLSLCVAGLGFIWIAIDHGNQAWHDKIAGTVVVRVPKAVHVA